MNIEPRSFHQANSILAALEIGFRVSHAAYPALRVGAESREFFQVVMDALAVDAGGRRGLRRRRKRQQKNDEKTGAPHSAPVYASASACRQIELTCDHRPGVCGRNDRATPPAIQT